MSESINLFVTQFTDEAITISFSLLVLMLVIFVVYWVYNRRRLQNLSHQIPASVVKNYLDSIIQNSTALKSSLFRGGADELGEGIPSVVPPGELPSGNVGVGGDHSEELNRKNAEIANLRGQNKDKDALIEELQKKLENAGGGGDASSEEVNQLKAQVADLQAKLKEAEAKLAEAGSASGGDEQMSAQLEELSKERDELKERLMEYEIIEDDLANLKRLQQENEQLKKSLAEKGGDVEAASAPEPIEEPAPEPDPEPTPEAEPEEAAPPVEEEAAPPQEEEAAPDESGQGDIDELMGESSGEEADKDMSGSSSGEEESGDMSGKSSGEQEEAPQKEEGEQKSAEELLSEFEKMLG